MRVLVSIHHELDPNAGAPGAAMAVAAALSELGHESVLHSLDDLPRGWSEQRKMVSYPWVLASFILRHRAEFDIVDSSTGDAWVWSLLRRRDTRPHLVVHSHGLEHFAHAALIQEAEAGRVQLSRKYPLYHGGWRLREVGITLRRSDAALFLNREEVEYATDRVAVDRSRAFLIHYGLSPRFIGLREPEPPADGSLRIAQIGTYIHRKGTVWSALALNKLMTHHPNVSVSFLGTRRPADAVSSDFLPEHRGRVRVVEDYELDDLPGLLEGHQIVMLPSLSEGLPRALLEGMACGLAAVSTRTPGPSAVVVDGQNGLLVPPADADSLEQALERLVTDDGLLTRMRREAYDTAQRFSWRENASRRLEVYEGLVRRRRGRAHRQA
jgi:glycosyltransferase involved in cell wall biosynthesis